MPPITTPAQAFVEDTRRYILSPEYKMRTRRRLPVALFVPNLLGYARIILAFVGMYYSLRPISIVLNPNSYESDASSPGAGVAIWIWICSAILDLLDGPAARILNQTSKFGVMLDVVADNILRTTIWISTAILAISLSATANSSTVISSVSARQTTLIALISGGIICLEWLTMLCTQLKSAMENKHWKSSNGSNGREESGGDKCTATAVPWIVSKIFENNFRSPLGIIAIYGLFSAGMWTYGSFFPLLKDAIPCFDIFWAIAICGRLLSMRVEIFLCWNYLHTILFQDEKDRANKLAYSIAEDTNSIDTGDDEISENRQGNSISSSFVCHICAKDFVSSAGLLYHVNNRVCVRKNR